MKKKKALTSAHDAKNMLPNTPGPLMELQVQTTSGTAVCVRKWETSQNKNAEKFQDESPAGGATLQIWRAHCWQRHSREDLNTKGNRLRSGSNGWTQFPVRARLAHRPLNRRSVQHVSTYQEDLDLADTTRLRGIRTRNYYGGT